MIDNAFKDQELYSVAKCSGQTCAGTAEDVSIALTHEHTLSLSVCGRQERQFVCSPAQLTELCLGWLCGSGRIESADDVTALRISADGRRADAVAEPKERTDPVPFAKTADADHELCASVHSKTRGTHGCVFVSSDGAMIFCEDIGRNNAMDKTIGRVLLEHRDPESGLLFSSGRINAEIVSKAVRAGFPVLVTKATVTAEAIETAKRYRLCLAFFSDGKTCVLAG